MQVFIVIRVHSWETNTLAKVNLYQMPHTSHVEGDQFLSSQYAWACWDMVARAIVFETPRLTINPPDQMTGQLVLIMASKPPSQPSSPPIYYCKKKKKKKKEGQYIYLATFVALQVWYGIPNERVPKSRRRSGFVNKRSGYESRSLIRALLLQRQQIMYNENQSIENLSLITPQDLLMAAERGLNLLEGGQQTGRRNSSARSRPRSVAGKR